MTETGSRTEPDEAVRRLEAQLRSTPRATRPVAHAVLRYRLGMALAELPTGERGVNLSRAVRCYDQAAALFRSGPHPLEHARVQNARGAALRELGQHGDALAACRLAVSLMPATAPDWERAAALNNLALTLSDAGEHDEAARVAGESVEAFGRGTDGPDAPDTAPQRAMAAHNLGQVLAAADRHDEAVKVYEHAIENVDREELPYQWGLLHHALGVSLTAVGAAVAAVEAFEQSLRVFSRTRHAFQHALAKNNLGLSWAQVGGVVPLRRAVTCFADSLAVLDTRLHRELWQQAFQNLRAAETELGARGLEGDQVQHFVALLAAVDDDERTALARDRLTRLLTLPEPRRTDALVEIDRAALALPEADAIAVTTACLTVFLELPDDQLVIGLRAQQLAQQAFDDDDALDAADWVLERAIADGMLAPQRIRVRDHLTALGYERR